MNKCEKCGADIIPEEGHEEVSYSACKNCIKKTISNSVKR